MPPAPKAGGSQHAPYGLLRTVNDPADLRRLSPDQLSELAAEIRAFLTAAVLAPYKQPDELRIVAAFPATAPGKVNRRRLRASLAASVPATQ